MDTDDVTERNPPATNAIDALALAASEASQMNTEDRQLARFEETKEELRALDLRLIQAESRMSSGVVGSVKRSTKDTNMEKTCNKRIFNNVTGFNESCGKTPVVMIYTKQHYCLEHRDLHRKKINAKNQAIQMALQENNISNAPPSMSVICALSDDGFYLDVFPGSHKRSYFDGKCESSNPVHFSDSERVHVPQTYAILFHKWFYHCGSAVPNNPLGAHCQLRLFAYVTTTPFSQDSVSTTTVQAKRLRSKVHKSDSPDEQSTFTRASVMCRAENEKVWLCDKCDGEKVKQREQASNTIVFKPKSNSIQPGKIVAGNMEMFGYIIFRTSISHEECEYLHTIEKNISGPWFNIGRKGKQKVAPRTRREQYSVEEANKYFAPLLEIPLQKLRKDILKVDSPLSKLGKCDKILQQAKLLRNVGPCAKQYPHSDYTTSDKQNNDNTKKSRTSAGGKSSI
eukprot:scaffold63885_cov54-Attheya_sp.AAC.4